MSQPVTKPTRQEIQRKLSVHPVPLKQASTAQGHVSGTESDSDSIQTPGDVLASGLYTANSQQLPLTSIAERASQSGGEDSDEDEDAAEGGWKTPDLQTNSKPRNSVDDYVIKSGYLWKKGERRKTWKKRWFVLRPAHLAYYKTSAEYQLLRLLDLSDIHSCTPVNLKRHDNAFGLISPNRTFYFQATNANEVRDWVAAIEDARQTLLATSTQNSGSTPIAIPTPAPKEPVLRGTTLSTSPGYLHPITSSDSEDGGGPQSAIIPPPRIQRGQSLSSPSPTAATFAAPPTKPSVNTTAATTTPPSKIVLSGYLMKCDSKRRNWRKRWFVLTGEKLVYSGSHMDTKPHRIFLFTEILDALEYELPSSRHSHHHGASSLAAASSPSGSGMGGQDGDDVLPNARHTFKIVTTRRNLLLCAPTEEDEIKWLGAVRALIARRSGSGVVPGQSSKNPGGAGSSLGAGSASGSHHGIGAGSVQHTSEASGGSASSGVPTTSGGGGSSAGVVVGSVGTRSKPRRTSFGQVTGISPQINAVGSTMGDADAQEAMKP